MPFLKIKKLQIEIQFRTSLPKKKANFNFTSVTLCPHFYAVVTKQELGRQGKIYLCRFSQFYYLLYVYRSLPYTVLDSQAPRREISRMLSKTLHGDAWYPQRSHVKWVKYRLQQDVVQVSM